MTVGPISEEFAKRGSETPDQWTLAWWREQFAEVLKGYRGATHGINSALAALADSAETISTLRKQCEEMRKERAEDRAKIGELQAKLKSADERITAIDGRVSRMAEFLTELKNESKKEMEDAA